MKEQTLIILKLNNVQRNLISEVLGRFEREGLKISALKMLKGKSAGLASFFSDKKKDF